MQRSTGWQAPIIALQRRPDLLDLDPPSRLQVVVALLKEARPVAHDETEHAAVDEVELLVEHPVCLGVVDDEVAVWRDEGWLDGREVGANDLGSWVLFGELDGPDARARADVEDVGRRGGERGDVEGAGEGHAPDVVLEVEAVGFELERGISWVWGRVVISYLGQYLVIREVIYCLCVVSKCLLFLRA